MLHLRGKERESPFSFCKLVGGEREGLSNVRSRDDFPMGSWTFPVVLWSTETGAEMLLKITLSEQSRGELLEGCDSLFLTNTVSLLVAWYFVPRIQGGHQIGLAKVGSFELLRGKVPPPRLLSSGSSPLLLLAAAAAA